jgi:hypothetical protein
VPTVSTKERAELNDAAANERVELARRRISEGYYDRPEVRRTLAALLLSNLTRPRRPAGSSRPKTA